MTRKNPIKDEALLARVATESHHLLTEILPPERESMTLGNLFSLIDACEQVIVEHLEKQGDYKRIARICSVSRHVYKNTDLNYLLAAAVLIGEIAVAAKRRMTFLNKLEEEYYLRSKAEEAQENIEQYNKRHRKTPCRLEKIAVFENTPFLCYNHDSEKLVLLSRKTMLEFDELEFYTADINASRKLLKKYFAKC